MHAFEITFLISIFPRTYHFYIFPFIFSVTKETYELKISLFEIPNLMCNIPTDNS